MRPVSSLSRDSKVSFVFLGYLVLDGCCCNQSPEVPPLRERIDDVPWLVAHFLQALASDVGRPIARVSHEAMSALMAYRWPGNVRELEHVIGRAALKLLTTELLSSRSFQFKPEFLAKVMSEKQLSDEAEAMLKDAIKEVTSSMLAAA